MLRLAGSGKHVGATDHRLHARHPKLLYQLPILGRFSWTPVEAHAAILAN